MKAGFNLLIDNVIVKQFFIFGYLSSIGDQQVQTAPLRQMQIHIFFVHFQFVFEKNDFVSIFQGTLSW